MSAYSVLPSLSCLPSVLQDDYFNIYIKDGDLQIEDPHHDGVNCYVLRYRKKGITDSKWQEILDNIYYGDFLWEDIKKVTTSCKNDILKAKTLF